MRSIAVPLVCLLSACSLFPQPIDPVVAQADAQAATQSAMIDANAEAFSHPDAERDRFIAEWTEGYEPVGEPIESDLSSIAPFALRMERGQCYTMVFRLSSEASFSEQARSGISFVYERTTGATVNGGPGIHGAGGVGSGGCPLSDSDATFFVRTMIPSDAPDLGRGPVTLQLMTKPISEDELAALEQDRERQIEEQRAFAAEQDRKKAERAASGCRKCHEEYVECLALTDNKADCAQDRNSCAFREAGLPSYNQC